MRIVVFGVHKSETILLIKRHCIQVCVHHQEAITRLVIDNEHRLNEVQNSRSNPQPLCSFINSQTTELYRRITFQTFFVRKPSFLAESIEFRPVLKITYSNLVVRKAAIGKNTTGIAINKSITNRQQMFLKSRCMMKNEIIQIFITTTEILN